MINKMDSYTIYETLGKRLAKKKSKTIPCESEKTQSHKKKLVSPSKLEVRESSFGGYGVFAIEDIKKDEVIEESTFMRTDLRTKDKFVDQITQVCYPLPCKCKHCKKEGEFMLLSTGNIHIYNHVEEKQDVIFDYFADKRFIRVTAIKDLKKDQEVLHNYGKGYNHWKELEN